ncbi:hypothetical protein ACFLS8_04770, partial [Chloroflexota bacterium]
MKKVKIFGGICLALIMVLSLFGAAPVLATEGESGDLPFNTLPVIVIQGSYYDMGKQYGQQAADWIALRAENKKADLGMDWVDI